MTVSVNPYTWRRRMVLALGATSVAAVASGCALTEPEKAHSLNTKGLEEVLRTSRELEASYSAAVDAMPKFGATFEMLRDNHATHAETIEKILGAKPQTDAKIVEGSDSTDAISKLHQAESDASSQAIHACVNAVERFALVLGEIAAGRASHVDALEVL